VIQIIPHLSHGVFYGASVSHLAVTGGFGEAAYAVTFSAAAAKHPWSVAGTFRHLVIGCNVPHPALTATLLVNGVATALTVSLAAGAALAANTGDAVAVAAGDDVCYRIAGTQQNFPGLVHFSTCLEFEGAVASYGITAYTTGGSVPSVGKRGIGGALGNGEWMSYGSDPGPVQSNTYSICAAPGAITRLDLKTFAAGPGGGAWVAWVRKNGVTQDGTGGTVDTACTLPDPAIHAFSAFSLPLALTDLVDLVLARTGSPGPAALAHVAASVAFTPTTAGMYMLCGGSNDAIRSDGPDWKWPRCDQLVTTESHGEAHIGPAGLRAAGLYVRRAGPPSPGRGTVYMLRRSGTDTPITLTIQDMEVTGQVQADVDFASGDAITVQATPFNNAVSNGFHWGLALRGPTIIIVHPPRFCPVDFPIDPND